MEIKLLKRVICMDTYYRQTIQKETGLRIQYGEGRDGYSAIKTKNQRTSNPKSKIETIRYAL